jgi:hypothetical protein
MTNWIAADQSLRRLNEEVDYEYDYIDVNRIRVAFAAGEAAEKQVVALSADDTRIEDEAIELEKRAETAERERDEARNAKRTAEENELKALHDLDEARALLARCKPELDPPKDR